MHKMSRIEQRMFKRQHLEEVQAGSGLYIYENNTKGGLMLPRATKSGRTAVEAVNPKVPGSGQFQGDSYYLSMVRDNFLRLVKVLEPASQPTQQSLGSEYPEYKSVEKTQEGKGLFLYENNTAGTLMLPKQTKSGLKLVSAVNPKVPGSGRFQGDNYFMSMVRDNTLRLISVLRSVEQEEAMSQEKLILDQPATITPQGTVEHVVQNPQQVVSEVVGAGQNPDVLLNENPMDDVEILGD